MWLSGVMRWRFVPMDGCVVTSRLPLSPTVSMGGHVIVQRVRPVLPTGFASTEEAKHAR